MPTDPSVARCRDGAPCSGCEVCQPFLRGVDKDARSVATVEPHEILYALDEPVVMLPYELCESAAKARYRGWQELDSMGMVDRVFDPRTVTAHVRWMYRYTDDAFAELTHRYTDDPMTPGAYKVWSVEVMP